MIVEVHPIILDSIKDAVHVRTQSIQYVEEYKQHCDLIFHNTAITINLKECKAIITILKENENGR